jgi:hypothetical protein
MSQTKQKCWTMVCGVPVGFKSLTGLSDALDVDNHSLQAAKRYAAEKGHATAFQYGGRMIYLGDVPTDTAPVRKLEGKPEGGPLLRGLCTHRIGICEGDAE